MKVTELRRDLNEYMCLCEYDILQDGGSSGMNEPDARLLMDQDTRTWRCLDDDTARWHWIKRSKDLAPG